MDDGVECIGEAKAGDDENQKTSFVREGFVPDTTESLLLAVALTALPNLEATVLRLHHESRLSFEDIAISLGLTLNDVRTAWVRGLRRFRRFCCTDLGGTKGGKPETSWSPHEDRDS